ncbi:hypothetical protein AVEN_105307-1 [Araneus ventricosus]|uniref:Uncharacterized protein n=1 Tax=Araneus ventricosus TaxID=182803 RepID=A0A4Y2REJ2_ARAVE|nr:hypothetical protein AVEN_149657-1 [Araneus ventricosus]GBN73669.1 hypothetical protein AVEN_148856-1 [Araneus ventricosus]GBN75878.1 hypothetical protein AVEN_105307-1 [Araneus ventricosus]
MVRFRYKLKIASFYLDNTQCVAKYSFVVPKSVTYLDLSLCELSSLRDKRKNVIYPNYILSPSTIVTSNFVCTEEGCKKSSAKNRKLLYDLHLDASCGLELRFGNNQTNKDLRYHSDRVLLNNLGIESSFLEMNLDWMVASPLARTNQ